MKENLFFCKVSFLNVSDKISNMFRRVTLLLQNDTVYVKFFIPKDMSNVKWGCVPFDHYYVNDTIYLETKFYYGCYLARLRFIITGDTIQKMY